LIAIGRAMRSPSSRLSTSQYVTARKPNPTAVAEMLSGNFESNVTSSVVPTVMATGPYHDVSSLALRLSVIEVRASCDSNQSPKRSFQ